MVTWVPTAQISEAPFSSAMSIAMSSEVAAAGNGMAGTPSLSMRSMPGARPSA